MDIALNRRELIRLVLGSAAAMAAGCSRPSQTITGELLGPDFKTGHRLRDGWNAAKADHPWRNVGTVIVGGGVSGLAAGWRLKQAGETDFVVLELEKQTGGTSLAGESPVSRFPWGAHYIPAPMKENQTLCRLFDEMGVIEGYDDEGAPVVAEQFLCRDPEERLFVEGEWVEGLYPASGASESDLTQWQEFRNEIDRLVRFRDSDGRRAFTIPLAECSTEAELLALDEITMSEWLKSHDWDSDRLRWVVDYCCRDDYGMHLDQTSAWAGLFYFASRVRETSSESQPLITWPEGNGKVVAHLRQQIEQHVECGQAVMSIMPPDENSDEPIRLTVLDASTGEVTGIRARRVICAAPQFVNRRLVQGLSRGERASGADFTYGSWIVANVHLTGRPADNGFPTAWDNVIYDSKSLGYVVSTHQSGVDHGQTVWTWYYPICDENLDAARQKLLDLPWATWSDLVLTDLEAPHPDIGEYVERIDIMRWGHAMIRPIPGFIWGESRQSAAKPFRGVHFANTDLSGVALFEEAFFHGVRAAEETMADAITSTDSFL